jgi:hypothetical protein
MSEPSTAEPIERGQLWVAERFGQMQKQIDALQERLNEHLRDGATIGVLAELERKRSADPPAQQPAAIDPNGRFWRAGFEAGDAYARERIYRDELPALLEAERDRLVKTFERDGRTIVANALREYKP